MNVLDERLYALPHFSFADVFASTSLTPNLITRQCFTQHRHQWCITGKKHSMRRLMSIASLRRDVQSDQRFARSRYTGDEANGLTASRPSLFYQLLDAA